MNFCKTKSGIVICPFFTWVGEDIERIGQNENDVSLTHCSHSKNSNDYEGNCQEKLCPLLKNQKMTFLEAAKLLGVKK